LPFAVTLRLAGDHSPQHVPEVAVRRQHGESTCRMCIRVGVVMRQHRQRQVIADGRRRAYAAAARPMSVSLYRGNAAIASIRFSVMPLYASPCVRAACPQIASTVRSFNPASWP
jgi:hypothetical protein